MDLSKLRGPKETVEVIEAFPASDFAIMFYAQMRYFDQKLREAILGDLVPKRSYGYFEDDERRRAGLL